jgi:hypothetical protein
MNNMENPTIIVFYLDRDMLTEPEIINPFVESINQMIEHKKATMIALFLPCGEGDSERVGMHQPSGC